MINLKKTMPYSKNNIDRNKTYGQWRKHVYASINGTKGNLIRLSNSRLLRPNEKEQLLKVIDELESLRRIYSKNNSKPQTT
jgi:hypothetical protein